MPGSPFGDRTTNQVPHQRSRTPVETALRQLLAAVDESGCTDQSTLLLDITIEGRRYLLTRTPRSPFPENAEIFSPREQEIAQMVARGYTNKEIARTLQISTWTVSTHLRRTFAKLSVSTRAAMVAQLFDTSPAPAPTTRPMGTVALGSSVPGFTSDSFRRP
ncbi:helix-turn-helix transcriptional regulator [Frankia sp. R43]|uniref:LuxR C-terminal-related transcriptional regulator n=1 Tax=Frankia sp. R43 TaxID=269536 RepID=UPI0007C661DC